MGGRVTKSQLYGTLVGLKQEQSRWAGDVEVLLQLWLGILNTYK